MFTFGVVIIYLHNCNVMQIYEVFGKEGNVVGFKYKFTELASYRHTVLKEPQLKHSSSQKLCSNIIVNAVANLFVLKR